jgi:ferredoxin
VKVIVDRASCTSLGNCEAIASEYFEVGEDGDLVILREDVRAEDRELVEKAVAACPTAALRLIYG